MMHPLRMQKSSKCVFALIALNTLCFFAVGAETKIILASSTISGFNQHQQQHSTENDNIKKVQYQYDVEKWLNTVDKDLAQFNSLAAHITWKLSIQSTTDNYNYSEAGRKSEQQARELAKVKNKWRNKVCESRIKVEWITAEQQRKLYLFCRGPKFSDGAFLDFLHVQGLLTLEYNSPVCLRPSFQHITGPSLTNDNVISANRSSAVINNSDFPKPGDCLYGEPDLERLMKRTDLTDDQLKWIWLNWHDAIGSKIKNLFKISTDYQNEAARNNGYHDIGETWREELEIPDLESVVFRLFEEMKPLYVQLHAVIRHKLHEKYGPSVIDPSGPIPIHLLGNMWGQDWSSLIDLFKLTESPINFNDLFQDKNWSVKDMVVKAEDFYTSLGLPKMTNKFWKYSLLEENQNSTVCHGTAANLYTEDDFRMLMCGRTTIEDFYVIHHEMGHIEYYMAYAQQPEFFQDGTNTAFHESIGDAIMHGVMTPQHLHRLGLLSDTQLTDKNVELFLLVLQGLSKIPEIPFSLIVDKYRWDLFKGNKIPYDEWNKYYWDLNLKYRGVVPPVERGEAGFDAGAKFHVPDNTPYIRYFLSSIIQMQIFKSLCEISLYGRPLGDSNGQPNLPLHRCDIYGSKNVGKKLLAMMERGSSIQWPEALNMISATQYISTKAILNYYRPFYDWLEKYIQANDVKVGW